MADFTTIFLSKDYKIKYETKLLNLVIACVNLLASTLLKSFQQQTGEKSCLVHACRGVLMSWNFIYTDRTVVSKCQSIFIQISTTPLQCFLHLWGLQGRKKTHIIKHTALTFHPTLVKPLTARIYNQISQNYTTSLLSERKTWTQSSIHISGVGWRGLCLCDRAKEGENTAYAATPLQGKK